MDLTSYFRMIQIKLIFSSFCKKDVDFFITCEKEVRIVNYNLPPSNTVVIGPSACKPKNI